MGNNLNLIGNTTELQCLLAFTQLGYQVSLPFGGQARYDFIADIKGKLIRIQVKTSVLKKDGEYLEFDCRNSHYINGRHTHTKYSSEEIDYFATCWNGVCYLIPVSECNTGKYLRLLPPKSGQITKGINWAKDYELEGVIGKIV